MTRATKAFILALALAIGFGAGHVAAARKPPKSPAGGVISVAVDTVESVNGSAEIPMSAFTEPYLYVRNCTGSKIYDEASYFRATQGALVENIPSDPTCTGAGIGSFQAGAGTVTVVKPTNYRDKLGPYDISAQFFVVVLDQPDYAISYQALPRTLLEIHLKNP